MDPSSREVFDCVMEYMYEEDIIMYYERLEACRTTCKDMYHRFKDIHKTRNSFKEVDFYIPGSLCSRHILSLYVTSTPNSYVLHHLISNPSNSLYVRGVTKKTHDQITPNYSTHTYQHNLDNYIVLIKQMETYVLLRFPEEHDVSKDEYLVEIEQRSITNQK